MEWVHGMGKEGGLHMEARAIEKIGSQRKDCPMARVLAWNMGDTSSIHFQNLPQACYRTLGKSLHRLLPQFLSVK